MSTVNYATPQELIEFLSVEGVEKTTGRFANGPNSPARCCLGHYAYMCDMPFDWNQSVFYTTPLIENGASPLIKNGVSLPNDHWLFTFIDKESKLGSPQLQNILAQLNDLEPGFNSVISKIQECIDQGII